MKRVPSVYTIFINTIYLSHSTKVDEGTVYRNHTILPELKSIERIFFLEQNEMLFFSLLGFCKKWGEMTENVES